MNEKKFQLAARLAQARKDAKMHQFAVEELIGLKHMALSFIERGIRSVSALELANLSVIYSVPVSELLDLGVEHMPSEREVIRRQLAHLAPNLSLENCRLILRLAQELSGQQQEAIDLSAAPAEVIDAFLDSAFAGAFQTD